MRRLRLGRVEVPAALLLWGPFAVGAVLWALHSPDDAFITLRYARNLVHGHGPVFDPGERVEGFSSPLHLLVDAVVVALPGGHDLAKAKLASLAFAIAALVAAGRLLRRAALEAPLEAAGLLLVGGSWVLALHTATGLETSLATFLVTALLASLLGDGEGHPWRTGSLAVASMAVRPEGVLLVGVVALATLVDPRPGSPRHRLRWAGVAAVGGAVLLAGRLAWFGSWVPNTVVAKHQPLSAAAGPGVRYVLRAFSPWLDLGGARGAVAPVLVALGAGLLLAGLVAAGRAPRRLAPVAAAVLAQVLVVVVAGGDWMSGARLLAPVLPAMVLLQVTGAGALGAAAARWRGDRLGRAVRTGLLGALVVAAAATAATQDRLPIWHSRWAFDDRSLTVAGGYDGAYWAEAPTLFRCARPGDLVASSEMGYVPWALADLHFIDLHGLVTAPIARHSAPSTHSTFGVGEPDWWHPSGPAVLEVRTRRPVLLVIGNPEARTTVLGNRYRAVGHLETGSGNVTAFLRADRRCPGQGGG